MSSTTDATHPRFKETAPKQKAFKIALVQLSVKTQKNINIEEAVKQIHCAKDKGAQLVVLPECFNSPYGTKYFNEYAEEIPCGETSCALSQAALDTGLCVVGGSIPERFGNALYNTCTVWDQCGSLIATHRKMHLFDIDIPGKMTFKESDVLSPGNNVTTFNFCGVQIGVGICYDLRFYELAHIMAAQGCSLLIYPGAFNMTTGPAHWELLGRSRANDEQLYVALVSPSRDEKSSYVAWGHTTLINPWGEVVEKLDEKDGILMGEIDVSKVDEVRSNIPIRTQRRLDIYETVLVDTRHKTCR